VTELIRAYYPDIQAIYLFGSAVNYQLQSDSDIDIALLLPHQVAKNWVTWQ
jgi:predicted nucleotidyltransferase